MPYLDELIARTRTMVERWHGRNATMAELTSSHSTLSVVVHGDEYGKNLVIHCISPEHICGPVNWKDSAIRIVPAQLVGGTAGVALVDERGGVRVTAASFEVKENLRLAAGRWTGRQGAP